MMNKGQTVLLACQLARSGFSGERVFRLMTSDGAEYVSIAPVDYCRASNHSPVGPDEPAKGQRIEGYVEGRVIENGGATAKIAVPDGEIVEVANNRLLVAKKAKETTYVPV